MTTYLVDLWDKEAFETKADAKTEGSRFAIVTATNTEHAVDKALAVGALSDCLGAIISLSEQIGQMSGMFADEDGAIQEAVDDGEEAGDYARPILQRFRERA